MVRNTVVAPTGCHVESVTFGAGWETWDRIVSELRTAGADVDDFVQVTNSLLGAYAYASAHYDDGNVRVVLCTPTLNFTAKGEPVLPEATW